MVAPWTQFWSVNAFVQGSPGLQEAFGNPFLRGAVSGIGGITALAGVVELASAVVARFQHAAAESPES